MTPIHIFIHIATKQNIITRVHTVWKVREKSINIKVGQGKSGKVRESQGKSGKVRESQGTFFYRAKKSGKVREKF